MEEFINFSALATKYTVFFIVINEERAQPLSPPCIIPFFHFFQWQEMCLNSKKQNMYNGHFLGGFNMIKLKQRKEWMDLNQRHSQQNLIWNPTFYSQAEYRIPAIFSSYRKPKVPGCPFKIQNWEDKGPVKLVKSILFGKMDNPLP